MPDTTALNDADVRKLHADLPAGWEIEQNELAKTFKFAEFEATMTFVNAVADIARVADHHPDMRVGYNTARIAWTTHDAGGLTEKDFACAAKTDAKA
ncbi:MAG: 4a-hydroxytetrahydrobiopterin dehydratase [Planctomycetota bacterium]